MFAGRSRDFEGQDLMLTSLRLAMTTQICPVCRCRHYQRVWCGGHGSRSAAGSGEEQNPSPVLLLVNAQRCSPITIDFTNQDGQLPEVEISCFSRFVTFACVDRIAFDECWKVVLWCRQCPCTSERPGKST